MFNFNQHIPLDDEKIRELEGVFPNLGNVVEALRAGGFNPYVMNLDHRYSHLAMGFGTENVFVPSGYGTATITFECSISGPPLKAEPVVPKAEPYYRQRKRFRDSWGISHPRTMLLAINDYQRAGNYNPYAEDDDGFEELERDYPYGERSEYSYDSEKYDTDPGDENDW